MENNHQSCKKRQGVFSIIFKVLLVVVVLNWVYGKVLVVLDHRRKVEVERFLRKNLKPEAFADYILVRDGINPETRR